VADLDRLGQLIKSRQPDQAEELEAMQKRYLKARPPAKGQHSTVAYRLCLLFLDRWNSGPD